MRRTVKVDQGRLRRNREGENLNTVEDGKGNKRREKDGAARATYQRAKYRTRNKAEPRWSQIGVARIVVPETR
jgi:hypothetical protein